MRRLLWALILAAPLAACGDDGIDELGDVDAAIAAPRPHDDATCVAVVGHHPDDGWSVMMALDGWGAPSGFELAHVGDEAEACAYACEWEAEHCDGGARESCGNAPDREPARCIDG